MPFFEGKGKGGRIQSADISRKREGQPYMRNQASQQQQKKKKQERIKKKKKAKGRIETSQRIQSV